MTSMQLVGARARSTTGVTALGVIGFAAALALASQVSVPVPGSPVPLTLQPLLVVLGGLMLGPRMGALGVALFLAAGAAGLPVFAPGGAPGLARLFGPTGGYLLAFPVAAFLAGYLSFRRPGFTGRLVGSLAGMAAIYVGGVAQLVVLTGSFTTAALVGLAPFAAADAAKAIVAAFLGRPNIAPR